MSNNKEISKAEYQVTHIFNNSQNKSDIIKNTVLGKFRHISNLTGDNSVMYNDYGGSIHSEEAL